MFTNLKSTVCSVISDNSAPDPSADFFF